MLRRPHYLPGVSDSSVHADSLLHPPTDAERSIEMMEDVSNDGAGQCYKTTTVKSWVSH